MKTEMKKLRCGKCGTSIHKLYVQVDNNMKVFVECTKCNSITEIGFTKPQITIKPYKDSPGTLTNFG